jgi:small subunit ribosomal protein S17e
MGTVYTKDIKRVAVQIYESHKSEISTEFSKNKEILSKYLKVGSKKVRNRVAGYLTRYAKKISIPKEEGETKEEE